MSSIVNICSRALTELGADTITDLTDNSPRASLCTLHFQSTVDEMLRDHPWNFSLVRVALALLTGTPAFEFSYQFQLPTDPYCLRVWQTSLDRSKDRWQIEGRQLLADSNTVSILYGARVTDPTLFDALFENALVQRLKAKFAYAVTGKQSLTEAFYKTYELEAGKARGVDGQESGFRQVRSTALTEVRS